jgi:nitronate monooxygenase
VPHLGDILDVMLRLGLSVPVVQAPMAQISTAELVVAVARAGALGSLGTAVLAPEAIEGQVRAVRAAGELPFALNFFCHAPPSLDDPRFAPMAARLAPYRRELGLPDPSGLAPPPPPFDARTLDLLLALRPPAASFHFGLPDARALAAIRAARIFVLATATSVEEARILEARGADAIVAQGVEAGGHQGTFTDAGGGLATLELVPRVAAAVALPVIAAGGIMDGRDVAAALRLGASAAQLGTAFLGCPEAQLDPLYRRTLGEPAAARTRLTTLFSGRPARAIVNRLLDELADLEGQTPAFPLQRQLVAGLAQAAASRGSAEFLAMWAGTGAARLRRMPAAELVQTLARELTSP